jgi:hypothetical protein
VVAALARADTADRLASSTPADASGSTDVTEWIDSTGAPGRAVDSERESGRVRLPRQRTSGSEPADGIGAGRPDADREMTGAPGGPEPAWATRTDAAGEQPTAAPTTTRARSTSRAKSGAPGSGTPAGSTIAAEPVTAVGTEQPLAAGATAGRTPEKPEPADLTAPSRRHPRARPGRSPGRPTVLPVTVGQSTGQVCTGSLVRCNSA